LSVEAGHLVPAAHDAFQRARLPPEDQSTAFLGVGLARVLVKLGEDTGGHGQRDRRAVHEDALPHARKTSPRGKDGRAA
jgi:hypothetical protein